MAETENAPKEGEEKKKGNKLFLIIGLVIVLAIGGGAGYYFFVMSAADKDGDEKAEKKKKKDDKDEDESDDLVLKSSKNEDDDENDEDSGDSVKISLPDDEDVTHVVELQPFVVNLADTDEPKYLRMSVSLGLSGEGGKGHEPDPLFLTRVKNAMLSVIATKTSEEVLSVKGKSELRKQLLKAAKASAEDSHIEAIYITDFIVQL